MDPLNIDRVYAALTTQHLGRNIVYRQLTGSTMDDARQLAIAKGCKHGTLVVAERQTQARGTKGHTWNAINAGNIYASFVLFCPKLATTFEGRFSLEVAACLAVMKVTRDLGVRNVLCKWPNDIWVRGHKLAGFLAEDGSYVKRRVDGEDLYLVILGIGINVNSDLRHSGDLISIATSLCCELEGQMCDREELLAKVCNELEEILTWSHDQSLATFRQENVFRPGTRVKVHDFHSCKDFEATFQDIANDWEIVLKDVPDDLSDKKDNSLKGNSQRLSIRPSYSASIVLSTYGSVAEPSETSLHRMLTALLDTSQFEIKMKSIQQILEGNMPENAALLVFPANINSASVNTDIAQYLCETFHQIKVPALVIANSMLLFQPLLVSHFPDFRTENLHPDNLDENGLIAVNIKNCLNNSTFKSASSHLPLTVSSLDSSSTVLAEYVNEGKELTPAILSARISGHCLLCLCGISVGEDYLDSSDIHKDLSEDVRKDIWQRDVMLSSVLKLLLNDIIISA